VTSDQFSVLRLAEQKPEEARPTLASREARRSI
jgi:hypothetical protein